MYYIYLKLIKVYIYIVWIIHYQCMYRDTRESVFNTDIYQVDSFSNSSMKSWKISKRTNANG